MKQDSCTACSAECPVFIFYKNANDSEKKRSEFELLFACTHAVQTTRSVFEVHVRITKRIRGERSCYFTVVCMHSCFDGRILSRWVYTQKVMPKTQNMSKNMFEIGKMGT